MCTPNRWPIYVEKPEQLTAVREWLKAHKEGVCKHENFEKDDYNLFLLNMESVCKCSILPITEHHKPDNLFKPASQWKPGDTLIVIEDFHTYKIGDRVIIEKMNDGLVEIKDDYVARFLDRFVWFKAGIHQHQFEVGQEITYGNGRKLIIKIKEFGGNNQNRFIGEDGYMYATEGKQALTNPIQVGDIAKHKTKDVKLVVKSINLENYFQDENGQQHLINNYFVFCRAPKITKEPTKFTKEDKQPSPTLDLDKDLPDVSMFAYTETPLPRKESIMFASLAYLFRNPISKGLWGVINWILVQPTKNMAKPAVYTFQYVCCLTALTAIGLSGLYIYRNAPELYNSAVDAIPRIKVEFDQKSEGVPGPQAEFVENEDGTFTKVVSE